MTTDRSMLGILVHATSESSVSVRIGRSFQRYVDELVETGGADPRTVDLLSAFFFLSGCHLLHEFYSSTALHVTPDSTAYSQYSG